MPIKIFISFLIVFFNVSLSHSMDFNHNEHVEVIEQYFKSLENGITEKSFHSYLNLVQEAQNIKTSIPTFDSEAPSYNPYPIKKLITLQSIIDAVDPVHDLYEAFQTITPTDFLSTNSNLQITIEKSLNINTSLHFRFIDLNRTKIVKQGTWEILHKEDVNYDYLVTSPLKPCCGIYIFNPRLNTYGLFHTDAAVTLPQLEHFFQEMGKGCEGSGLHLKLITYSKSGQEQHLIPQYGPDIEEGQIRHILFDTISQKILPKISPVIYPKFDIDHRVSSPEGDPFYIPELLRYQSPLFEPKSERELEKYFTFLFPLTNFIYHQNHKISSTEDFKFHRSYFDTYSYLDMASFGIGKMGNVFSTNYALSARTYGLPKSMKDLYLLPYRSKSKFGVVRGPGKSIYRSLPKGQSAVSLLRLIPK